MDNFLSYYNNELAFLRAAGNEFAKANPKVASQLRLNEQGSEDPHIARIIEAFAFLTARIQHKINDDLPEFADTLLNLLYPHYQLPVPALSIVQFQANPEATEGHFLSKGIQIESSSSYGSTCQFSTCYDTIIYPTEITRIELIENSSPTLPFLPNTQSALTISMRCLKPDLSFSILNPKRIRFFINIATPYSYQFYDLLFKEGLGGFIVEDGKEAIPFPFDALNAVGFNENEGLFPYPEQSMLNYRLLTEFFIFPEKFLFFDLTFKDNLYQTHAIGREITFVICFKNKTPSLRPTITKNSLSLHCTPLINLFDKIGEPILIDQTRSTYPIIPDARRLNEIDIYKIQSISLSDYSGVPYHCVPLYGFKEQKDQSIYWHSERKNRSLESSSIETCRKEDIFISFVDNNHINNAAIAQPHLLCTNHQLPSQLPHGGHHPKLQFIKDNIKGDIRTLSPFTPSYHLPLCHGVRWQLISHLMLNTFSFSNNTEATKFIKEMLQLYNFSQSEENSLFISNIESVTTKPVIARGDSHFGNTILNGTEVIITFTKEHATLFLFSSVLEKFLTAYCSINSFTQLTIRYANQSGDLIRWKPNMGTKSLL